MTLCARRGSEGSIFGRGFDSPRLHHVAADGISFAAAFCKSHLSLILSRLLPNCDPLRSPGRASLAMWKAKPQAQRPVGFSLAAT